MTSSKASEPSNSQPLSREEFVAISKRVATVHLQDWVIMAQDVFGITLDEEQQAILRSVQHNKRTVVKSGTGRGKDFIAAVASLCFLYNTPTWNKQGHLVGNTKVFLTAPTDRQIGNIMFPEISRLFKMAHQRGFALPGRLTGHDIRMEQEEWFLSGFKADDHNIEAWTGLHAVNIMILVTEASGLHELVAMAMEGNLQGNYRFMLVFNDNNGTGYAADAMKNEGWAKFRLDSLNAPNVKAKKIVIPGQVDWERVNEYVRDWCVPIAADEAKEEEGDFEWENEHGKHWYRPNDTFRVKVRGMAPKVAEGVLVPGEWIDLANERWKKFNEQRFAITKPLRQGTDVAGMGRDSTVKCDRYGSYVKQFTKTFGFGEAIHMKIVGSILDDLKTNTDEFTGLKAQGMIDTIGEGAGVYSRLQELKQEKGKEWITVHSCKASAAAVDSADIPLKDRTGQREFFNMRAYLYWSIREWLDPANKMDAMLPVNADLYKQLTETKWWFRSDGKVQIEDKEGLKKRIKKSPDEADALSMTFWPVPDIDPTPKKKKNPANYFH